MRQITSHQASPLDDALALFAADERGSGNANHHYVVADSVHGAHAAANGGYDNHAAILAQIKFQNGPIKEHGVNGVSNEVLLAIVADRLEGFQAGPYACDDNASALAKIKSAMDDLQKRTKERLARGVEGTSAK